ncbi:MAG TPA: NAD(P)H-binding protein [Micropruina sp.]|nr:NAD(P)H-binding protein [Micropruina sp.]
MAHIVIIGGTGYAGSHIAAEAVARGHAVTSWSRSLPEQSLEGVSYRTGSVTDDATLSEAVDGADVVIETLSPRGSMLGQVEPVAAGLAKKLTGTKTRLGVIGGAGSLQVSPGGPRVMDGDQFPDAFKAEAAELGRVLDALRASDQGLDWFFVSPAAGFGAYAPGERTGHYRVGGDVLLVDEAGRSDISGADLAIAIVDEIERPAHHRRRFTVAY